jgi:hypothetical protein
VRWCCEGDAVRVVLVLVRVVRYTRYGQCSERVKGFEQLVPCLMESIQSSTRPDEGV